MTAQRLETPPAGQTPLATLGVIRAQGEDAASFLHGQLTQDFTRLGADQARLAAYCLANGRVLASFVGVRRAPDDILLVCSADLLDATLKRLSMFVLRAKARLSQASNAFEVRGLVGAAIPAELPDAPWSRHDACGGHLVRLYPALGVGRALWIGPVGAFTGDETALAEGLWPWLEVMSGVTLLTQPVREAFVPQMLNLESVGGVNFKKGCYPGQEVVARSQFRGTLKRRSHIVETDAPLQIAQEVFHDSDPAQPCGTVVAAAAAPGGGWNALVSLQISAMASGQLHAGSVDGPQLNLLPLPYALLEDV